MERKGNFPINPCDGDENKYPTPLPYPLTQPITGAYHSHEANSVNGRCSMMTVLWTITDCWSMSGRAKKGGAADNCSENNYYRHRQQL